MLMQLAADALWRGSDSLPSGLLPTLDSIGVAEDCSLWKDSGSLPQGPLPGPDVKDVLGSFKVDEWLREVPNGDSYNGAGIQAHATQPLVVTSAAPSVCMSAACDAHTETCGVSAVQPAPAGGRTQAGADTDPSAETRGCNSQGSGSDEDYTEAMHADDEDAAGNVHSTSANGGTSKTGRKTSKATLSTRAVAASGVTKKRGAKGRRRTANPKSHASVQRRYRERQKVKTMQLQEARYQLQDQARQVDAMRAESAALKVSVHPHLNALVRASGCQDRFHSALTLTSHHI